MSETSMSILFAPAGGNLLQRILSTGVRSFHDSWHFLAGWVLLPCYEILIALLGYGYSVAFYFEINPYFLVLAFNSTVFAVTIWLYVRHLATG